MVLIRSCMRNVLVFVRKCSASAGKGLNVEFLNGNKAGIVVFGLNRPEQKNAFNGALVDAFNGSITQIEKDSKVRALVVRSLVPEVFCAGADLKERLSMSPNEVAPFVTSLRTLFTRINTLPFPTIAAIDYLALGGGLELALACDLRIASSKAKMGLVETKLAIIPGAGGTQRLPRLINPSIAKQLIFTGRVFNGDEAYKLGVVTSVVEQNSAGNAAFLRAIQVAEDILENGALGVKMAKIAIDKGLNVDLDKGLEIEGLCYDRLVDSEDRLEGLRAFQEKRKPKFKGC